MTSSCPECGSQLSRADHFCPECGRTTGPAVAVETPPGAAAEASAADSGGAECGQCGRPLSPVERFCPKCGTPRDGNVPRTRPKRAWALLREHVEQATAGRYEIEKELGRGGMAAVYLAREKALNRRVAIKALRSDLVTDDAMVARFLREARTMANLHHPNIVTIYAVESADDLHYIAMQYVPGRSLDRIIADAGPLPVSAMQAVVFQAARGLMYAHEAGIVHRDIKPGNIMIDVHGNAIVTDFGIAKVSEVNVTATTTQMGTPLYMSPEQCLGDVVTPASDQYALGNIAYEMVTGRPPFVRDTPVALALAITTEPVPAIGETHDACPGEIEEAIRRMLAKSPTARFANVVEAAEAVGGAHLPEKDPVREYLGSLAGAASPRPDAARLTPRTPLTPSASMHARRRRKNITWAIVAGAAAVLVAIALLILNARGGTASDTAPSTGAVDSVAVPSTTSDSTPAGPLATPSPPSSQATPVPEPNRPTIRSGAPGNPEPNAPVQAGVSAQTVTPSDAVVPPTPLRDTAPPRVETPPPAAVPPRPVDRGPDIRRALDRFEGAINSRSLSQMRAVYPGLSGEQESQWRDLFGNDVESLNGNLVVRSLNDHGSEAEASFLLTLTFKPRGDAAQTARLAGNATLRPDGGSWRITSMSTRPQ